MQFEIVYKDLPQNILFIYTTICDKKYGIINEVIKQLQPLMRIDTTSDNRNIFMVMLKEEMASFLI